MNSTYLSHRLPIMKKVRLNKSQKKPDKSIISSDFNSEKNSDILTLEELRSFSGFENIDDEEGLKIIKSLYQLSLICYDVIYK